MKKDISEKLPEISDFYYRSNQSTNKMAANDRQINLTIHNV